MSVRVFAPAKINLTLEVGWPRADGYHPLQSAVAFAGEGDWVEASEAETLTLKIEGPFAAALQADEDNLVLRAARLLEPRRGAALKLEKNLPIASGIGGGSSDAAATLIALNQIWALGHTIDDLARISASLGADLPVCVYQRTAWMTDVGTSVTPMYAPKFDAVLVNQGKPLATSLVYRQFDKMGLGGGYVETEAPDWSVRENAIYDIGHIGNDLEIPANSLMPELQDLAYSLNYDPRTIHAGMSGSGATLFALTANADDAAALANDLSARNRDWWVRATTLGAP